MKNFKNYTNFILEANEWSKTDLVSSKNVKRILNEVGVDLDNDHAIFRSLDIPSSTFGDNEALLITPTKERNSAYARNYYTLLINNLPSWSEYPKRTHICSNKYFRFNQEVYRVIPLKSTAKIGICPGDDIQAPYKNSPKKKSIYELSKIYSDYDLSEYLGRLQIVDEKDWNKFKHDLKEIKKTIENSKETLKLKLVSEVLGRDIIDMFDIDKVNNIFNPEDLKFNVMDYAEYKTTDLGQNSGSIHLGSDNVHEVWLDGEILLLKLNYKK